MSVEKNMNKFEKGLSKYACRNSDAIRFDKESNDIRTPFFRDIDRIIYSLSYTRYLDKTQVFSNSLNTNISKRMTHVQLVSKIARTIGRALGLNEDLIEASALGHDLGHVPFGHVGETILNKISLEHNEGYFNHNVQSARTLMYVENNGKGINITLQVLDAIMCHNGELPLGVYKPKKKTKETFLQEYNDTYHNKEVVKKLVPMTLEGCVVRISDIIGYIGRDIEDAIRLGVIDKDSLPPSIIKLLGDSNKELINNVILDIINNSFGKDYIKISDDIFKAICDLKHFNYENIYMKANSESDILKYERMFNKLFSKYLNDIKRKNYKSSIFQVFLNQMDNKYLENSDERKVIDFIAGMTDEYFQLEYESIEL